MKKNIAPILIKDRIPSLDFLRGIAILGILFINMESFAYPNPWSSWQYGYVGAEDHDVRFWVYFLTQGKFYTLFALLFGVGFAIFLERLQQKANGIQVMDTYARRLLWLFVIGVVHAYFIWDGDILYHYALCGFLLIPFRSMGTKALIVVIGGLALLSLVDSYVDVSKRQDRYAKYLQALEVDRESRTGEQQSLVDNWERRYSVRQPVTEAGLAPKATYWQGVLDSVDGLKVHRGIFYHTSLVLSSLMVMILGMVLYRIGIFSDYRNLKHYWVLSALVVLMGLWMNYVRYYHWTYKDHEPVLLVWKGLMFSLHKEVLGLGYLLVLNGLYQKYLKRLKMKVLSKIGRTALSNYILQSILLGVLFYGYGFGLSNSFSRSELLLVVPLIWSVQILLTLIWLNYRAQGPLEMLWRKLTYKTIAK